MGPIGRVVLNYQWLSRDQKWYSGDCVDQWIHNLPVWWMALVVFAITYLAAGGIFATIMALAKGERVRAFKSVSPALLGPMGTVFGLLVVFSVVQVWSDMDRANVAGLTLVTR